MDVNQLRNGSESLYTLIFSTVYDHSRASIQPHLRGRRLTRQTYDLFCYVKFCVTFPKAFLISLFYILPFILFPRSSCEIVRRVRVSHD